MSKPREARKLLSAKDAREQAAEQLGFMAGVFIDLGDGEPFEIPNPSLLDPDQQDRYDQLLMDLEGLDRHPDPVEKDGSPKLGADGVPLKGSIMLPHRKDGVRVENYETRLAKALFGDDDYKRFIAAGGRPSQIGVHWSEMRKVMADREAADKKSQGSDPAVGDVPDAD